MKPTIDDAIYAYMQLRANKEALETKIKSIKSNMLKLEAFLQEKLDGDGLTSLKSAHGTVFITEVDFASVKNWDAVLQFVRESGAYDLLGRHVSKTAVRSYIEATQETPPGVYYGTRKNLNVRKPATV